MAVFGRRRGNPVPNQLQDEAEPNTLSWVEDPEQTTENELNPGYPSDAGEEEGDETAPADTDESASRRAALQAELDREAQEFGLTSDPTARYGPYGEDVARVLNDLAGMDAETASRLADGWMSADPAGRARLDAELDSRYRRGKYGGELAAAESAVASWLDSKISTAHDVDLWRIVGAAGTGAVDALILNEELDDADYGLLYGAWDEIVGRSGDELEEDGGESDEDDAGNDEDEGEFGANTDRVAQMLARLGALSMEKLAELQAFWRRQPQDDLHSAHRAVQAVADENPEWREQIRAAQDQVKSWSNGTGLVPTTAITGSRSLQLEARIEALPAAMDAVTALVAADLLEAKDAETLYAPWAAAIGEPALPTYDDEPPK